MDAAEANVEYKAHVHVWTGWAFMGTVLFLRTTDLADIKAIATADSFVTMTTPRRRSQKLNNDTTTTNFAPDDNDGIVMI